MKDEKSQLTICACRCSFARAFLAIVVPAIVASLLSSTEARACDPNCGTYAIITLGIPAALGTTIVAPLIGQLVDTRPRSPYWTAVGLTALAAGTGVLIARAGTNNYHGNVTTMVGLPILLGSFTTTLVYLFWPRDADATERAATADGVRLVLAPVRSGAMIAVGWRF